MNKEAKNIIAAAVRAARNLDSTVPDILPLLSERQSNKDEQETEAFIVNQAAAARLLSVSRFTIYNMEKAGEIKPVWIRGAKRFRISDLQKLAGVA